MSRPMESGLTRDERGVVTYTVDDAPTRNALSTKILVDIDQVLAALAQDRSVRAVVFTGAGTTFSSGADRSELGDPRVVARTTSLLSSILVRIDNSPVPVVSRVNGAAFGAGLAIMAAADITIAVTDAVFGLPEVHFGLVAGPAAVACLARIGQTAALDVLLTGRRFDAEAAHRMQLVTAVVERDQLDAAVDERIAELLRGDYDALARTRRLVRALPRGTVSDRLAFAAAVTEGRQLDQQA